MKDEENILPRYLYERRAVITSFNFGLPKNLEIPEGIIGIAEDAFQDCPIIESVRIPGSVDFIRGRAFKNCRNLRHVEIIGEGVLEIACDAFKGCKNLTSVKIGRTVKSTEVYDNFSRSFGPILRPVFSGCSALEVEIIGEGVLEIGRDAFRYCENLTSVTIGGSVETIGDSAFYGCESLTSVTIPDSVTTIGKEAFRNCSRLTKVTFDDPKVWYLTDNDDYTGGSPIDVTKPETNAANLINDVYGSDKYWAGHYLYKSKE